MGELLRAWPSGRMLRRVAAFASALVAVFCLGGGAMRASAVVGPTWWKVDTHEHSSFSGDGRQDLGLLSSNDKSLNYNAIFVTDHDRAASFAIADANGNHLEYKEALSTRWHPKTSPSTISPPSTYTNSVVSSQFHSGSQSLHVSVVSQLARNLRSYVYANRGPTLRVGDDTLDFWVLPAQIDAGS